MKVLAATRFVFPTFVVLLTVSMQARTLAQSKGATKDARTYEGLIIDPDAVAPADLDAWKKEGFDAIVLVLDERYEAAVYQKAAKVIAANGLDLYYWIEVGRCAELADAHPEWISSIQGPHPEWRRGRSTPGRRLCGGGRLGPLVGV